MGYYLGSICLQERTEKALGINVVINAKKPRRPGDSHKY